MKVAIRYYTRGGNTQKLAEAISAAINVEAKPVTQPLEGKVDVLFLCNSVYWAGADAKVKNFVKDNATNIGKLVNVSTAGIIESTYKQIKSLAEQNGVAVNEREFHCKGSFVGMHRGKPDDTDCQAAAQFAKGVTQDA